MSEYKHQTPKTWLDRDFDRAAAAILCVNDRVTDPELRQQLRRAVLNELELLKLRVVNEITLRQERGT